MSIKPAIVVVAYNRPNSLRRILSSIHSAKFSYKDVPLVISIDKSDVEEVRMISDEFEWVNGHKKVECHNEKLGLKEHILWCGSLTKEYGSVIVLEDDLFVSPNFYEYAYDVVNKLETSKNVAGYSLYSYDFNEFAQRPFYPIDDGYDNYYLQVSSSWGQIWTEKQWVDFYTWYLKHDGNIKLKPGLPKNIVNWPESSWKKFFIEYLVETNKYFFYPKSSYTTNFSDVGTHQKSLKDRNYQVSINFGTNKNSFSSFEESLSVYDAFFELNSNTLSKIMGEDLSEVEIDLYGLKLLDQIKKPKLLSIKNCQDPIETFSYQMKPSIMNYVYRISGEALSLGNTCDFNNSISEKKRISILLGIGKVYEFTIYLKIVCYLIIRKLSCQLGIGLKQ
ncbi:hypothetical protein [Reichenbachiella agariperforans]|uniref:hypothetical protein n=1 Tax=Reichenbachiella agariperforans TaxID=156994 RepID=UPI001C0987CE|nr:hypothetical protein [Reichenbachiella agariperforans]MBU2916046.1 hypothetical protein [Reichenbachiella agariperforans]